MLLPQKTDRLVLRYWQDNDTDVFLQILQNPKILQCFTKNFNKQESLEFIQKIKAHFFCHGFGFWALSLKQSEVLIGYAGLRIPPYDLWVDNSPCLEIGWLIGEPYWGKGFAAEAAKSALQYGFEIIKVKEIVASTAKINPASIRVMEKIGMIRDVSKDFLHPRVEDTHILAPRVFYRIKNNTVNK